MKELRDALDKVEKKNQDLTNVVKAKQEVCQAEEVASRFKGSLRENTWQTLDEETDRLKSLTTDFIQN